MKHEIIPLKQTAARAENEVACCPPVLVSPALSLNEARSAAELFSALADPTRLVILSLIARSEEGEVCVCDITASFKLGQPTISHHLKILRDAHLIQGDKRGKWVYYSLVEGQTEEVKRLLDDVVKVPALV